MDYNFSAVISSLRKSKNLTQEELAGALNISAQAISKWETGACLPDTQMLPLLAKYFNVTIDYLFNGGEEIIERKTVGESASDYIASFGQFKGYPQALELFARIHSGLFSASFLQNIINIKDGHSASVMSSPEGLSLFGENQSYGVIISRRMFEDISPETLRFAKPILEALSDSDKARVILAVISMNEVSFGELTEMTEFDGEKLRGILDGLISGKILWEEVSKHKSLGTTYTILDAVYSGLCTVLASLEIMRNMNNYISGGCFGYGDYPVKYK
jgi:transcriptional regulator with XRE-family HTH domain